MSASMTKRFIKGREAKVITCGEANVANRCIVGNNESVSSESTIVLIDDAMREVSVKQMCFSIGSYRGSDVFG